MWRFIKNQKGFTLIEVILAASIALLVLVPLSYSFLNGYQHTDFAFVQTEKMDSAQKVLAMIIDGDKVESSSSLKNGLRNAVYAEIPSSNSGVVFTVDGSTYYNYFADGGKLFKVETKDRSQLYQINQGSSILTDVYQFSVAEVIYGNRQLLKVDLSTQKGKAGAGLEASVFLRRWRQDGSGGGSGQNGGGGGNVGGGGNGLSDNAYLSNLEVSSGTLVPAFVKDKTLYTVSVPYSVSSITVTPTVEDTGKATVTVKGDPVTSGQASNPISLNIGSNPIPVVVTAEDGNMLVYNVIVLRAEPNNNANLSNLELSSGALSPAFNKEQTSYSATVKVTSITVTPTVEDPGATVTVNGVPVTSGHESVPLPLILGSNNIINVVVTAEDGATTKSYSVNVTRILSDNAYLSDLDISRGTLSPDFLKTTTSYSASVANNVTSITVTPTVDDTDRATVKVNNIAVTSGQPSGLIPLNVGLNTINVVVTAENGTTTMTYTVTVTRLSKFPYRLVETLPGEEFYVPEYRWDAFAFTPPNLANEGTRYGGTISGNHKYSGIDLKNGNGKHDEDDRDYDDEERDYDDHRDHDGHRTDKNGSSLTINGPADIYVDGDININHGTKLIIQGGRVRIYLTGDLKAKNSSAIKFQNGGQLELILKGGTSNSNTQNLTFYNGFTANSDSAQNFLIEAATGGYVAPPGEPSYNFINIVMKNNSHLTAGIFAPNANMTFEGSLRGHRHQDDDWKDDKDDEYDHGNDDNHNGNNNNNGNDDDHNGNNNGNSNDDNHNDNHEDEHNGDGHEGKDNHVIGSIERLLGSLVIRDVEANGGFVPDYITYDETLE